MIIETVRAVREALEHSTYGVAKQLQAITLDDSSDTKPTVGMIIDQFTSVDAAVKRFPDQSSGVSVGLAGPITFETVINGYSYRDASIPVRVQYVVTNDEAEIAQTQQAYMMLAIQRCISSWISNTNAEDRYRNQVRIENISSMEQDLATQEIGDGAILCAVSFTVSVRDHNLGV